MTTSFSSETLPLQRSLQPNSSRRAYSPSPDDTPSFTSQKAQTARYIPKPNIFSRSTGGRYSVANVRPSYTNQTFEESRSNLSSSRVNKSFSQDRGNKKRAHNALYSSKNTADVANKSQKTSSNGRPVSSMITTQRTTSGTTSSRSPIRGANNASENFIRRMENARRAKLEGERLGAEGMEIALHRKNLEEQVLILENRLNKLKSEDELMARKIKETSEKTDKILDCKKRRHEELRKKELRNKKKEEDLQKRRMEINKEKDNNKSSLRKAVLSNFKNKHETAYGMKMDNEYYRMLKDEIKNQRDQKNRETIARVQSGNDLSMTARLAKDLGRKGNINIKYMEKIDKEKEKTEKLSEKCRELERLEHQMLEKLSQTYSIHKAKIVELEKAFVMKVKPEEE